jgi:dipeptidyl-peptidase-3
MTQPSDANLSLPVSRLEVEGPFSQLTKKERFHIYYATKAAVACSRVVLKQVSPESSAIFDLVVALGNACNCNWQSLAISVGVEIKTVHQFLEYAARVLNSLGNYEACLLMDQCW